MTRREWLSAGGVWLTNAAASTGIPLARIGVVTDVHYADKPPAGTRQYRDSLGKMAEAVEAWKREGVSAVVELGDLVDSAESGMEERRYLKTIVMELDRVRTPRYCALGNHCVWTLRKEEFLDE